MRHFVQFWDGGAQGPVEVAAEDRETFAREHPALRQVRHFVKEDGGKSFVDGDHVEDFLARNPGAKEYLLLEDNEGRKGYWSRDRVREFVGQNAPGWQDAPGDAGAPGTMLSRAVGRVADSVVGDVAGLPLHLAVGAGRAADSVAALPPKLFAGVDKAVEQTRAEQLGAALRRAEFEQSQAATPEGRAKWQPAIDRYRAELDSLPGRWKGAYRAAEAIENLQEGVANALGGTTAPQSAAAGAAQGIGGALGTVAKFAAAGPAAPALMVAEGTAEGAQRINAKEGSDARDAIVRGAAFSVPEALVFSHPAGRLVGNALGRVLPGAGRTVAGAFLRENAKAAGTSAVQMAATTALGNVAARDPVGQGVGEAALGGLAFGSGMHAATGTAPMLAARAGQRDLAQLRQRGRDAMQDHMAEQTQRHADDLAGRNGPEAQRLARARDEALVGEPPPEAPRLPVESLPDAARAEGGYEPRIRGERLAEAEGADRGSVPELRSAPVEPFVDGPLGTEGARRPWADALPPRLPETPEGVAAARRAELENLRQKEPGKWMKRTSHEAYRREHEGQTPVLDALGWDRFKTLRDRHKGDFRNVVGDREVNARELAEELGRDPSRATASGLLEEAADEFARYERWRDELGAPASDVEQAVGQEIDWNRRRNDEAIDEARRRWEETHPEEAGEPPPSEPELRARDSLLEDDFVERTERGVDDAPPSAPAQAPIPDEFAPRPAEPRPAEPAPAPVAGSATPPRQAEPVTVDDLAGIYGLDAGRVAAIKQAGMTPVDFASGKWQMADDYAAKLEASGSPDAPQARAHANEMLRLFQEVQRRAAPPEPAPAAPEPTRRAAASPQQQLPGAPKTHRAVEHAVEKAAEWADRQGAEKAVEAVRTQKAQTREAAKDKFEQLKFDVDDAREALEQFDKAHEDISSSPELQRQRAALEKLKWENIDKWDRSKLETPSREDNAKVSGELTEMFRAMLPHKNDIHKIGASALEKLPGWKYSGREGMKGRERAYDKTVKENGGDTKDLKDLSGGTLTFPAETNEVQGYVDGTRAVVESLPPGATILRIKAPNAAAGEALRRAFPDLEVKNGESNSYRDTKVNIRYENGAVAEMIVISDWMNTAKKEGHHAYDVTRILETYKGNDPRIDNALEHVMLYMAHLYDQTVSDSPEARSASERLRASACDSLNALLGEWQNARISSADAETLTKSLPGLQTSKHPLLSSISTTRPSPSENRYDIATSPVSSRGATTAPTPENLPQGAPGVNPRAGAQAAPAQAAPGLAAPAAPEGGSRRPGVGGGVVTPPPPGSVQARLEGMLAVDGADAPLTPERSGEYRALADEAGRSGNYATRARALQRLGEFEGLPADHPEAARSLAEHEAGKPLLQLMQLPDLVEIARTLGHGSDPKVKRVLSPGWAAGLFRPEGGRGGVPIIEVLGKLHQVVPQTERQRIAGEENLEAVRRLGPDAKAKAVKALEAEIYGRKFEDAWNDALARGPGQAMNVLAHEIGHWIDYLPDHIQKRGNILGHLAALDKWAKGWLAAVPGEKGKHADVIAAGDAAEAKVLRQPAEPLERFMERRQKARSAAEEKAALARGFLMKRDVERELSDLVAWYRCSDGLPDYFKDPGELFAEAFSAYCNAPATTRAKAPKFAAALDGWLAERPEAQRAVFEGRARAEKLAAQALRTGKAAPDLDFFGRLREKIVAGTLAREKAQLARKEAQRQPMRDVCDLALATFVGRMEPIFRRARAAGGWKEDLADRVMGSILRFEHAGTAHEAEILRVRSELLPIVEGLEGGQGALDEFLMLRRIASETLGKERERGRVNLANPSGVTPGSAREVEWGRSAQARLQWIRENQPEQWERLNRAADVLVDIRRGRGHSVLAELRDSGLIREDAMKEIWNNTDYAAFRRQLGMGDALPPVNGKRAAGDMSTWSGVYKQVTGSYGDIESPLLATLVGDATILRLARLNAARRDTAALLRRFFPDEVREVDEARWHSNSHGEKIPEQSKDARWRTLVWKENGETRALEVPRLVADALADERKDWGAGQAAVNFFNAAGRAWSMAMTGMNYAFATKNVFRDKAAIARAMPGRDWDQGAGAWLSNIFGDYATAAKTFASGHGQARRLGRANAELLQGLEEGVVAPGTMGGYMASLRGDDLAALYGPDTPARQRAIRGILEKSGLAPCIEKERTVIGKLAGKLWKLYASGIEKLADQETNNKVQAMLEIRRLHPEWSENRVAFHVARYIGTPDPTDAPNITKVPGFNLLFPFWTMTAHGNYDQLGRLYRDQKVASLARYGTHFAAKALMNFSGKAVAAWGAAQLVRAAAADDGTDEGRAEAADLRAQAAMAEDFASMQEAIPVHDRFTGVCIPLAWADKDAHKVWYLRIPSDQTIVPVDAATMGGFAINAKQADWHDILDGSLSTTVPSLGPFPTAVYGLATGQDLGRGGRSIDPEDGGNVMASRIEYFLKTAGVNAAGLWTKAPWAAAEVGEDVDALERFLRIPGFNATFGSFLRCSNGGRKAMAREYNKEVKAERLRNAGDADAYLAGDEAALVRLRERGADVGELIERAQKRRIKLETIRDPLERAGVQSGRARWNREKGNW